MCNITGCPDPATSPKIKCYYECTRYLFRTFHLFKYNLKYHDNN